MIKKTISAVSLSLLIFTSSTLNIFADSNYKKEFIKGSSNEISMELNKSVFKKSDEAILVNEKSIVDAISVTPLAYAKDAPIITTEWKNIDKETLDYIKDLGVKKITIIGGLKAISRSSERKLTDIGIEVERIQGMNRHETSLKIAKELNKIKPFSEVMILSSSISIKDAISVYSYLAKESIPIIWVNDSDIKSLSSYISKNKFDKVYAIGDSHGFTSKMSENIKDVIFIKPMKKTTSNIDFMNKYYDTKEIDNIYIVNSEIEKNLNELDFISLGVVAAKQDAPILLSGDMLTKKQSEFLDKSDINEIIEVGYEVEDYNFKKIIMSKNSIGTAILIILLIVMYIRVFKK